MSNLRRRTVMEREGVRVEPMSDYRADKYIMNPLT